MNHKTFPNVFVIALIALSITSAQPSRAQATTFNPFALSLIPGEHFAAKTTLSYRSSAGMSPVAFRGSFDMKVVKKAGTRFVLETTGRFGTKSFDSQAVEYDPSTYQQFQDGTPQARSLLSFFFDPHVWGSPPSDLSVGERWKAPLREAWEYGPAGDQDIRVISIDKATNSTTLERRGEGMGPSVPQVQHASKITMTVRGVAHDVDVSYQKTHWIGRAVIRDGLVMSSNLQIDQEYATPKVDVIPPQRVSTHTDLSMTVTR